MPVSMAWSAFIGRNDYLLAGEHLRCSKSLTISFSMNEDIGGGLEPSCGIAAFLVAAAIIFVLLAALPLVL